MITEILGMVFSASSRAPIVGVVSVFVGAGLVGAVSPDTLPVLGAAMGVGIGIAWAIVGANRDRAREALLKELDMIQGILNQRESDLAKVREAKMTADKINAALEVRISRLEEERSSDPNRTKS